VKLSQWSGSVIDKERLMTHDFTEQRLRKLTEAHGLDIGGHAYELWEDVPGLPGVVWANPHPSYAPWISESRYVTVVPTRFARLESPIYVWVPADTETAEFPKTFTRSSAQQSGQQEVGYRLIRHGRVTDDDNECLCWDESGHPFPDCRRCDGDGFVPSESGCWALYALDVPRAHTFDLQLEITAPGERPKEEAIRAVLEHSTATEAITLGLGLEDAEVRLVIEEF
jgi:hypothetical protein